MATILNDDNTKDLGTGSNSAVATPNAAIVTPASSGSPSPASGQFSTLQKYLGANTGAGSRIANMVGKNISQEAQQLGNTTNRELQESNQANQSFSGLTDKTKDFTEELSKPLDGPATNTPTEKAYDVNSYTTNLSGQKAAQDIANNQERLGEFRGLASGDVAATSRATSQKEAQDAISAANRAYDTTKERQTQLSVEPKRQALVSDTLNTKNQRMGVRALDDAFLSQDKNRTLDTINNNLRQSYGGLVANQNAAANQNSAIQGIATNQSAAEGALNQRMQDMQQAYLSLLQDRVASVNAAKDVRTTGLNTEFGQLRDKNEATQNFANLLGLTPENITKAGADTSGIRLFNTLKDQNLDNVLDTSLLRTKATSGLDVANKADIGALQALAALMGQENAQLPTESKFVGEQLGASKLPDLLNERINTFNTKDLGQRYSGTGMDTESINERNWYGGSDHVADAAAQAHATATLNDYLYGQGIARNTQSATSRTGNLGAILNNWSRFMNPLELGAGFADHVVNNDPNRGPVAAVNDTFYNDGLTNLGYRWGTGGLEAAGKDEQAARYNAEGQAVGSVDSQLKGVVDSIGYNNLLKIIGG